MTPAGLRTYFAQDLGWGRSHQASVIFDFLTNAADECVGGVVLDAGAGHQRYRPFFQRSVYLAQEHPEGIDKKSMQDLDYDLIAPVDEKIPLSDDCLDGIISTSVLEHLRYPERFFPEGLRVLKPGGKLYVHVPFTYPEHEAPFDFQRPTRFGIRRWFEDAGFEDVQLQATTSNITAATAFLKKSIFNDTVRRSGLNKDNVVPRSASDALALLRRVPAVVAYLGLAPLASSVGRVLQLALDKGPHANTDYPLGWVATGRKPGRAPDPAGVVDRAAFLVEHRLA